MKAKGDLHNPYAVGLEWIGGPVSELPTGQVTAQIYPSSLYERIVTPGVKAEIWMEPGISIDDLPKTQAVFYRQPRKTGSVVLVLGGGNVAGIPVNGVGQDDSSMGKLPWERNPRYPIRDRIHT